VNANIDKDKRSVYFDCIKGRNARDTLVKHILRNIEKNFDISRRLALGIDIKNYRPTKNTDEDSHSDAD